MADQESKITLTGEDKTGAMYKSAKKNADDYIKSLEKILQLDESGTKALRSRAEQTKRDYKELLELAAANKLAHKSTFGSSRRVERPPMIPPASKSRRRRRSTPRSAVC